MECSYENGSYGNRRVYKSIALYRKSICIQDRLTFPEEPVQISMILGSCAGVCLYDRRQAIGGATHYMLPQWEGPGSPSTRYGDVALDVLLKQFQIHGSNPNDLEAKVFGGACMFQAFRAENGSEDHIGSRNINMAVQTFSRLGIVIAARDTGGRKRPQNQNAK